MPEVASDGIPLDPAAVRAHFQHILDGANAMRASRQLHPTPREVALKWYAGKYGEKFAHAVTVADAAANPPFT